LPSRRQLEELLESEPDDVFLRYALAKACISEGDIPSGLARFQDVIDRQPDYVPAYFQAGQALAENGRLDEARQIVSRGIGVARRVGDQHALSEMTEFLDSLRAT
jgi:predicted Zn-dependent protease